MWIVSVISIFIDHSIITLLDRTCGISNAVLASEQAPMWGIEGENNRARSGGLSRSQTAFGLLRSPIFLFPYTKLCYPVHRLCHFDVSPFFDTILRVLELFIRVVAVSGIPQNYPSFLINSCESCYVWQRF